MPGHVLQYATTRTAAALALAALLAAVVAAASGPGAGTVGGRARVIDGDTLAIGDTRVRLEGIDAPEAGQQCGRGPRAWPCGAAAARHLERRIADREVQCEGRGHDAYGRLLGVCSTGALELNADLVRHGLAWAFVKYSRRYVEVEAEARTLRAGIWQGEAEPAWEYRAKAWAAAQSEAPGGCAIKGNVTHRGRLYHTPWSPFYGRTRIDAAKGERWFCSESEAMAAGWRPAGPPGS